MLEDEPHGPHAQSATDAPAVLVTVTGEDTPGITAALTAILADSGTGLLDVEQVVVHGQLTLCMLVDLDPAHVDGPVLRDLLFTAKRMGLDLDFSVLPPRQATQARRRRYALTVLAGAQMGARGLARIAGVLAEQGANIDSIRQLSDVGLHSAEIVVSIPDDLEAIRALRRALAEAAARVGVDVAIQRETVTRRAKRLVIMDMDSTLIQVEVIDELARLCGVEAKVAAITKRAMAGELDFSESLRARAKLLEGLEVSRALALAESLPLTDGAETLVRVVKGLGYKVGVISGGFDFAVDALKRRLGLDYAYANTLEVRDGRFTGGVVEPIVDAQRKADLLATIVQSEGITREQCIAIGDGANDIPMLQMAGLGIAFHGKAKLREAADTSLSTGGLERMLYLLGFRAEEIREFLERSSGAGVPFPT